MLSAMSGKKAISPARRNGAKAIETTATIIALSLTPAPPPV